MNLGSLDRISLIEQDEYVACEWTYTFLIFTNSFSCLKSSIFLSSIKSDLNLVSSILAMTLSYSMPFNFV